MSTASTSSPATQAPFSEGGEQEQPARRGRTMTCNRLHNGALRAFSTSWLRSLGQTGS